MDRFNEADVCSKILLPYLKSLNIKTSQIKFEKTFSIRLGRSVYDVKQNERNLISGRLDVLVKDEDGNNLFIFELKATDQKLTKDDVDQGISYARLLDQIAPFVIVSNVKNTQIFDTYTKKEITGEDISAKKVLSIEESINLRFEALSQFLGYSSENLQAFCKDQNSRGMLALKGTNEYRKYNPKTYVKRKPVRAAVNSFVTSDSIAFAILGESGVGKTNELCSITEELATKHLVLFLNANEISESVEKSLYDEFDWGFPEQTTFTAIVKRLENLGKKLNKRVIIIIDSLDEAVALNFERKISELTSNIESCQGHVKLIVSIKTSDWKKFSQFRDVSSKLALHLDRSWYEPKDVEDPKPYILTKFNSLEKEKALKAYSKFYQLSDIPEGSTKNACDHPFMLRVVSELYANNKEILGDLSEENLISSWIQKKLNQTDGEDDSCRLALIYLSEEIYKESLHKNDVTLAEFERASFDNVHKDFTNIDSIRIFKKLESIGFITIHTDEEERKSYSFYYGPVRDYFIAKYILRLDEISPDKLTIKLPNILKNRILRGALFWHLRKAPSGQIHAVKSHVFFRASEYIKTYNCILDSLFPHLKHLLPPNSNNGVGVCFINRGDFLEYGLFPLKHENDEKVIELKFSNFEGPNQSEAHKQQLELNVVDYQGGGDNFLNSDPKKTAAKRVLKKVKGAIENGVLNESSNSTLLQEGVLAIISSNEFLHRNSNLYKGMRFDLPLNLNDINKQIQIAFGRYHYLRKLDKELTQLYQAEKEEMDKHLAKEIERGITYDAPHMFDGHELQFICTLVRQLRQYDAEITKQVLPLPYSSEKYYVDDVVSSYSDEQMIDYICIFFTKAFDAYKDIVTLNFPGIFDRFENLQKLPYKLYVEFARENVKGWNFKYAVKKESTEKTEVVVKISPDKPLFQFINRKTFIDGIESKIHFFSNGSVDFIFLPRSGTGFNRPSDSISSLMPIRNYVYDLIKRDFENVSYEDLLTKLGEMP